MQHRGRQIPVDRVVKLFSLFILYYIIVVQSIVVYISLDFISRMLWGVECRPEPRYTSSRNE
jgi:hypothetical protein